MLSELPSFFDWLQAQPQPSRPWLILGKGPSFGKRAEFDTSGYRLMSLNHVVRELPVDAAHIIDIDVVSSCAEVLLANAGVLVMPWFPHQHNKVGEISLPEWTQRIPTLATLAAAGRLCWYDLAISPVRHGPGPVVQATFFSAEAALSLLALAGVPLLRSLGVDGGQHYSERFEDLSAVTRLNNGHASYDLQFAGMARTLFKTGVDFAPLDMPSPIEVLVGSEEPQRLAVKVLEYSIRRRSSVSVRVRALHRCGIEFPLPRDAKNAPRTPFSFQRFAIPMLCGYRGRGIYLDSDMLVFRDIRELWSFPMAGAEVQAVAEPGSSGRKPQFSVMLLDCEQLADWTPDGIIARLDSGELSYESLMFEMAVARSVKSDLPQRWNALETYTRGDTALLHYTDMTRQPWVTIRNPNGHLWVQALLEAIDDGFITRAEVETDVACGWVRPSLLLQLEHRAAALGWRWPLARWLDRNFVPPYKKPRSV